MKRFFACLLIAVMLMPMASFAMAQEQETIRLVWWGGQARADSTTEMVNRFMEKHPNIKVEIEFTDFSGYWSKLATQAVGGLLPDVLQMDYAYLTQYVQSGVLADMSGYIESGAIDMSGVSDSMLVSGKVGDGIYAIPTGSNVFITAYRKDIADQAGVELPMEPSYTDWVEASKAVYKATGRTDDCIIYIGDKMRFYVRDMGLELFNDEGTALGFDDPIYLVEMWQRILDAQQEGYGLGVGEGTRTSDFDRYVNDTWINSFWSNQLEAFEVGSNCELTVVSVAHRDGATRASNYFKPTMFWSVPETSEHKDAAATFINFFVNDPECYDIVGIDRGMPISQTIREYLAPTFNEASRKIAAVMDYLGQEGKTSPLPKPDIPAYGEYYNLLSQYTEEVTYGLVNDLTAHAQAFMDEVNAIIAKSLETN